MGKRRGKGEGSIFQRKDGTWQGAVTTGYTENGKQNRRTVYGKTQKDVRERIDAIKQQLASGTLSDTTLTVKAYLEQWLKEKTREVKPQTVEDYRYQLDKYVVPHIGRGHLGKLTPMHVQTMCGALADAISPQRANKCRRILSGALTQAVRWQLIPRNPADAVKPLKTTKPDMVIWTAPQASQFLDTTRPHRLYALFYLAMSTGMRRGELLGLRWRDVQGPMVHVNQAIIDQRGKIWISTPKSKRSIRRIAVSQDVLEVLELHRKRQEAEREFLGEAWPDNEYVFTSEVGTFIHPRNLSRTWYGLMKKAKVTPARLHDLRHLHASMLIAAGANPKYVADRLGHSNASFTLDVYAHLFEEQRAANPVSILDLIAPRQEAGSLN